MFRHGDELNVLKNINLSIIGIEQAEEFIDDETFTFLRDRLRRDNAPYRQLCVIGNTNGHNWIWRLWKDNPSSEEFELNEATTFDNAVNLPKDFTEDLKCMEFDNPAHYAQYVMNSWEDIGERLYYPMFSRNLHIVPYDRIAQKLTVFNILDPHDRKFWCMAWIGIDKTGTSYVIDEYPDFPFDPKATGNKTYSDYKDIIRQKDEVVRSMFNCHIERRYIDPNFGNKTIQLAEKQGGQSVTTPKKILLEMGLQYFDAIDALQAGHMKVAESLRYEKIANEIVKQPSIFVLDNCKNTIEHLSHYSGKNPVTRDGDVKDVVMPLERYKDFADLVRYYLMANPKFNDNVIDNDVEISHYRRHL